MPQRRRDRIIFWSILGAFGFVVLVGILGAVAGGSHSAAASKSGGTGTLTEENVRRSFRNTLDFMPRASGQALDVRIPSAGIIVINVSPSAVASEGDTLTIAAQTAVVANKAIWTKYPDARTLTVNTYGTFTDQYGHSSSDVAASITIERSTANHFDYTGLKDRVLQDNKALFCVADGYTIHPAIYRKLGNTGCLLGPNK